MSKSQAMAIREILKTHSMKCGKTLVITTRSLNKFSKLEPKAVDKIGLGFGVSGREEATYKVNPSDVDFLTEKLRKHKIPHEWTIDCFFEPRRGTKRDSYG